MSALAGLWRFDGRPDAESGCQRMLRAQHVYGPHATGTVSELSASLALGRNLYRLLPEDAFDRQPLVGSRWTVASDVRLDNREELCATLAVVGASSPSDADVVAAAVHRWGEAACERLYGEFAFAAFDRRERRLLLARCPAGLRPLHYHEGAGFFAFASLPKGLHALEDVPRVLDEEAIAIGLAAEVRPHGRTFFAGVTRLEPGSLLTVGPDGVVRTKRWWSPARGPLRLARPIDYVQAARAELDGAVRRALRGTHEVASHLSAGLDSAGVTATAARLQAAAGGRVIAFTAAPREGYDGPLPTGSIGDESPIAAAVAAMYANVEHVVVRPPTRSYLRELDRYVLLTEQPVIGLPNQVWVDAIHAEMQARGLTILLTGAMGNLGLSHEGLDLLPQLLRRGRLLSLARSWWALKRGAHRRYRASAALTFGPFMPGWLWRASRSLRGLRAGPADDALVRAELLPGLAPLARQILLDPHLRPPKDSFDSRIEMFQRVDRGLIHKGVLAAWGIDQRDPTSDRALMEFFLQVPADQFLMRGEPRGLARAVLADRLPSEVLVERGRGLQAADWHEAIAADLPLIKDEIARIAACEAANRIIDAERLAAMADAWPSEGLERSDIRLRYRAAMLRAISTGHFMRRVAGTNA